MKFCRVFISLLVLLTLTSDLVFASDKSSKARLVNITTPNTSDEKAVLNIVRKIYSFSSRDYICIWEARKIPGDFVQKFKPYFSDDIVRNFFEGYKACEVVGSARYGFLPLDDPDTWNDKQYGLVQIAKPEVVKDKATVEVRFWTSVDKKKNPLDQDHGGTIVYLTRINSQWKVTNLEGTWILGGAGFQSLIDGYPSSANPEWRNMDYRKALKSPQPYDK